MVSLEGKTIVEDCLCEAAKVQTSMLVGPNSNIREESLSRRGASLAPPLAPAGAARLRRLRQGEVGAGTEDSTTSDHRAIDIQGGPLKRTHRRV